MSCCHQEQNENQTQYTYSVAIKFRNGSKPYSFGMETADVEKGDYVVVETTLGLEIGIVDAQALEIGRYGLRMPTKPVMRKANASDLALFEENKQRELESYAFCEQLIEELGLQMHLLTCQYALDASKVLFVYLADNRVDFRELLKRLSTELHCRIELKQIGERDKAKMVGAIGVCGRETCCSRFKTHFDVISINMAKNQQLSLNTEKLTGMCGKLKCCLKYEDDYYTEILHDLPKLGSHLEYNGNMYKMTNINALKDEVKLENHEEVIYISVEDVRTKTQVRKGVTLQRHHDDSNRPVQKTVTHVHHPEKDENPKKTPKVSMEVHLNPSKTESKQMKQRRHQANKPNKNVTVRTFGKKKESQPS